MNYVDGGGGSSSSKSNSTSIVKNIRLALSDRKLSAILNSAGPTSISSSHSASNSQRHNDQRQSSYASSSGGGGPTGAGEYYVGRGIGIAKKHNNNNNNNNCMITSSSYAINNMNRLASSSMTLTDAENNSLMVPGSLRVGGGGLSGTGSVQDLKKFADSSYTHQNNINNNIGGGGANTGGQTATDGASKRVGIRTPKASSRARVRHAACMCAKSTLGLVISTLICVSIVSMTYFFRRSFNTMSFYDYINNINRNNGGEQRSANVTLTAGDLEAYATTSAHIANITLVGVFAPTRTEFFSHTRKLDFSCEFCFLIIWTMSSQLIFTYPLYFLVNYVILANHKRAANANNNNTSATSASASVSVTAAASTQLASASIGSLPAAASSPSSKSSNSTSSSQQTTSAASTTATKKAGGGSSSATNTTTTNTNAPRHLMQIFKDSFNIFNVNTKKQQLFVQVFETMHASDGNGGSATQRGRHLANTFKLDHMGKILSITFVWLLTAYSYLRAVDLLCCSDLIILFSFNYSFVYMGEWTILHQYFVPLKLFGIILFTAAFSFAFYLDALTIYLKLVGFVLALVAAFGSSILQLTWNNTIMKKGANQIAMFYSLLGLFSMTLGVPLFSLLYASGLESFDYFVDDVIEPNLRRYIFLNTLFATLFAIVHVFLMRFGFMFVHGTFIRIGCLFSVPLATIIDIHYNDLVINNLKILAICFICVGYFFLILPENWHRRLRSLFCHESHHEQVDSNPMLRKRYLNTPPQPSPKPSRHFKYTSLIKSSYLHR